MFYLAYGSNLNIEQMLRRCPRALKVGKSSIPDMRLVFRVHADIEQAEGESVPVGVWHLTPDCERALDRYEGVASGYYRKEYLPIRIKQDGVVREERALVYVMNDAGYESPLASYFAICKKGYKDFGLPIAAIEKARDFTQRALAADFRIRSAIKAGDLEIIE